MSAKGVFSVMAVIIFLYPLTESVDLDRDHKQLLFDNWEESMMDDDTVELLWVKCRSELVYSMEGIQDLEYYDGDKTLIGKERILKAINLQDPQVKKTILDCLRDKRIVLTKSRKDKVARNWYIEYLVSFVRKPKDSHGRRKLAQGSVTQGTLIVVIIVTAVLTLCVAGGVLYCYIRNYGINSPQNDEPLTSLSMDGKSANGDSNESANGENSGLSLDASSVEIPHMKTSLDPVQPPVGRVQSNLRHTLKPRAVRAESSLRPTTKTELHLKLGGKTESPVKGTESPLRPGGRTDSPVKAMESSPQPSPKVAEPSPRQPPSATAPHSPATVRPAAPTPATAPATPTKLVAPSPSPSPPPPPRQEAPPPPPPPSGGAPPPPPPIGGAPPPPPPTGGAPPPPPPKPGGDAGGPPPPPRRMGASIKPPRRSEQVDVSKAKLKPFFWDKVMAKPDQQMVWDKIKSGSFQFNEEMIESLFGYQAAEKTKEQDTKKGPAKEPQTHMLQIIDPKKAQNLSILLKALNVTTEEVSAALIEGNELPIEIVQTLLKMAPTSEEELKLRLYGGEMSRLGPAERFLKSLVEIPYAFKRLESLLFMCTLQEEESNIKESLETLDAACVELKKSRLFHKLLEAVLKTGNRMNVGTFRGSAKAFKLDTLLKLSDVKGIDGKTTLLHFVVQEIMRGEGIRAVKAHKDGKSLGSINTEDLFYQFEETDEFYCKVGLEVMSGLSSELENVAKAAIIDTDGLTSSISKLGYGLVKARESLNTDMKNLQEQSEDAEADEFWLILTSFVDNAEKDITWMFEEEKRIMGLMKSTADYFHGTSGKDEGLRLFSVVRDFLVVLEKVCKEIQAAPIKPPKKKEELLPEMQKTDDSEPGAKKDDQNQSTSRDSSEDDD